MVVVKKDILSYFKKPLSTKYFGENKTWRGFIVMPLLTILPFMGYEVLKSLFAIDFGFKQNALVLGVALGFAYVIFELPNSFIKRKLGIQPGKLPERNKFIFALMDQADSVIGCALAYYVVEGIDWAFVIILIGVGTSIHLVLNYFLYKMGIRKNPL